MTGFVSENELLLKGAQKNKKMETRLKMRLQSLIPDKDIINKGFSSYNPIKNARLLPSKTNLQSKASLLISPGV